MKIIDIGHSGGRGWLEIEDSGKTTIFSFQIHQNYEKSPTGGYDYDKPIPPDIASIFDIGEKEFVYYLTGKLFQEYKTLKGLKK